MADNFRGGTRSPTALRTLTIRLLRATDMETGEPTYAATYGIQVEYDDGTDDQYSGNLIPILAPEIIADLKAKVDAAWDKALADIGLTP